MADGLTQKLLCYVKERKKIGEFETFEINPNMDGVCRKAGIGIGDSSNDEKKIWVLIEFNDSKTLKGTLFHGSEEKLRVWVESINKSIVLYEYLTDAIKRWDGIMNTK